MIFAWNILSIHTDGVHNETELVNHAIVVNSETQETRTENPVLNLHQPETVNINIVRNGTSATDTAETGQAYSTVIAETESRPVHTLHNEASVTVNNDEFNAETGKMSKI